MPRVMAWAMAVAVCSARRAMVSPRSRRWVEFAGRIWDFLPGMRRLPGCWLTPAAPSRDGWVGLGAGGRSLVRCGLGLVVAAPPRGGLALGRLGGRLGGGRRGKRLGPGPVAAVALAVARGAAGGGGAVAGLARGPAGAGGLGRGRSGGLAGAAAPAGAVALG